MNVSIVKLNDSNDYAIIAPGQITYALNASAQELLKTEKEVYEETKDYKLAKENLDRVSLAIMPTYDCNLRCIYCYANGGKYKEVISMDIAKKAIDYVRDFNKKASVLDLYLVGGGEPLLYFDLVKEIVGYADSVFKKVEINVVTNGTFSKNVREWLVERKANIRVSYDVIGQDKHRPLSSGKSSKNKVENNIKELLNNNANIIVQCIISSYTVDKMKQIIDKLIEMKVPVVKMEPCLMTDVSRGTKSLQPDPAVFANKLLEAIEYVADNELPILIDTGYFTKPTIGKYCGLGNGNFTVTPEGMITSCVEVSRKNDPYSDTIMFGKITDKVEINEDKLEKLDKINYNNQKGGCSNCQYRLICLGGCPMANIWQSGLPLKKSAFTCTVEHTLLPKLLLKIIENKKIMNVIMENTKCE